MPKHKKLQTNKYDKYPRLIITDKPAHLNSLLNKHYDHLIQVAKNISWRSLKHDQEHNLLNQIVVELHKKVENDESSVNYFLSNSDRFLSFVTYTLHTYYINAKNRIHQQCNKDNVLFTYQAPSDRINKQKYYYGQDEHQEELIYIQAEIIDPDKTVSDYTKAYLVDMYLNDLPPERGILVNKINSTANNILNKEEFEIYDLFFMNEMSCYQIFMMKKVENEEKLFAQTELTDEQYIELYKEEKKVLKQYKYPDILSIQKRVLKKLKEALND